MVMIPFEKLVGLNSIFGIWRFNDYLRVTFVYEGWLIVWDHRNSPPIRHDCKAKNHQDTCVLAANKLQELCSKEGKRQS